MKIILIFSSIFLLLNLSVKAEVLEIPEIKVYGERKVKIRTIKKKLLPFEEEYLQPSLPREKSGLPPFKIHDKRTNLRNMGFRLRGNAGTNLGVYFLTYTRNFFYPFEIGANCVANSVAEDSSLQVFSRASAEGFYFNSALHGRKSSKPLYRLNIGKNHKILGFEFKGVYSDSLIGVSNATLNYNPFQLNLQIETSLDYNAELSFEKYPLKAGINWFQNRIYPELVFFLPIYNLYIESKLLDKTGIAYLYSQSPQYFREYSSSNTCYRMEIGKADNPSLSLFYSYYLNDSLSHVGLNGDYKGINVEIGYPLKDNQNYFLRGNFNTEITEEINLNIFSCIENTENYYIGTDLSYNLTKNLSIGIEGNYIYGWKEEDGFDISGYFFLTF